MDFFTLQEEMPGSSSAIIANNCTSKLYSAKLSFLYSPILQQSSKKKSPCNTQVSKKLWFRIYYFCVPYVSFGIIHQLVSDP